MKKFLTIALALVASSALAAPKADGKIDAKEYANTYKDTKTGATFNWTIDGDTLYVGVTAKATGWVGVGFNPTGDKKDGADMYMFVMEKGKMIGMDGFMAKPKGEPKWDDREGCKNNLLTSGGALSGGNLTVEFSRKLDTGDKCDVVIKKGAENTVLIAHSDNSNIKKAHKKEDEGRSESEIVLK